MAEVYDVSCINAITDLDKQVDFIRGLRTKNTLTERITILSDFMVTNFIMIFYFETLLFIKIGQD